MCRNLDFIEVSMLMYPLVYRVVMVPLLSELGP
jgi:hypothetical protein